MPWVGLVGVPLKSDTTCLQLETGPCRGLAGLYEWKKEAAKKQPILHPPEARGRPRREASGGRGAE